ncbi:hypothetical protein ACFL22_01175 [Patescibacteria group bacterium]
MDIRNQKAVEEVAKGNYAFFCIAIGIEMRLGPFIETVLHSFNKPAQYYIQTMDKAEHFGHVNIDCVDVCEKRCTRRFASKIDMDGYWLLGKVARKVPDCITGELNTDVVIIECGYKFTFHISGYVRDQKHSFEIINDPTLLSDGERITRILDLKITVVK